ncbi:MAG TPA: Hpt domain-containing protein [Silvibacterium sp.]|nr:Hpt domain-containing protein [Silvibacterium sp.]
MLIDDDGVSLAVISLLLKQDGYEVVEVADGTDAIRMLGELHPDALPSVLLADLRMPGICGRDLAVALRRVAPQAILLAMSATPDAAEGYDGFFEKPLDPAALRAALEAHESAVSASAVVDQQPALDEAVYKKLLGMMPREAVSEIYEVCLNDTRARVAEMRSASAANNLASVRRIAHTIKGGVGMIGAQKLAAAAAELELGDYRKEDVPHLIDNLLSCCDQLQRILLAKLQL